MNAVASTDAIGPQWFILFFPVVWFAVTGLLSTIGGWASLARKFREGLPERGEHYRFVSGSIGSRPFPVNYGGCLFVSVNNRGFRLAILFPFRFLSPPLFITWSHVETVVEKRFLFSHRFVVNIRNQWPVISLRGKAGQSVLAAYARFATQPHERRG